MIENQQEIQDDANNGDGQHHGGEKSKARIVKGQNPQVNWRIPEDLKNEIEDLARRRGVGAGQIIKELWSSQHADMMKILQIILGNVEDLVRQYDDPSHQREVQIEPTPDQFAHRDPATWQKEPGSAPIVQIVPLRRSWLQRIFGGEQ